MLDACGRPLAGMLPGLRWIDLAALACVAFGVNWRGLFSGEDEGTPLDGLVMGALAVGTVVVAGTGGRGDTMTWLSHALACAGIYFGLTRALRRDPAAVEAVWWALAGVAIVLGLYAVGSATAGPDAVARGAAAVDARWGGHHVLPKTLGFLALVLAGRALDRGPQPLWRLAALLAATGALVQYADGMITGSRALARIDDPIFFSTLCVSLLLVAGAIREAWRLGRSRAHETLRWRALALALAVLAAVGVLSEASGGEGVRVIVAMAGAAIMAARTHAEARDLADLQADVCPSEADEPTARAA